MYIHACQSLWVLAHAIALWLSSNPNSIVSGYENGMSASLALPA